MRRKDRTGGRTGQDGGQDRTGWNSCNKGGQDRASCMRDRKIGQNSFEDLGRTGQCSGQLS